MNWNPGLNSRVVDAVVCSLVFVGVELRQNSFATMAQTNYAVAESFIEINLALATSSELASAITSYKDDPNT